MAAIVDGIGHNRTAVDSTPGRTAAQQEKAASGSGAEKFSKSLQN